MTARNRPNAASFELRMPGELPPLSQRAARALHELLVAIADADEADDTELMA